MLIKWLYLIRIFQKCQYTKMPYAMYEHYCFLLPEKVVPWYSENILKHFQTWTKVRSWMHILPQNQGHIGFFVTLFLNLLKFLQD